MGVGVEVLQLQVLHPVEQVPAHGVDGPLGKLHVQPHLAVGGKDADQKDTAELRKGEGQAVEVAGDDIPVDQRLEKIGPHKAAARVQQKHHHQADDLHLVPVHIAENSRNRAAQVLRLLKADRRAGGPRAARGHRALLCHQETAPSCCESQISR